MKPAAKGILLILLSAIGFSLMPFFAIRAYQGNVSVATLLWIRFSAAAICFFLYIWLQKIPFNLSLDTLKALFIIGTFFCTGESALYYYAIKCIPVSLAVLILYTYPILVFLFSVFISKRATFHWTVVLSILLCFGGLIPLIEANFVRVNLWGLFCAAGAALLYAGYILYSEQPVKLLPSVVTGGFVSLFTAVGQGVIGFLGGTLAFNFKPEAWLAITGLILFSTLFSLIAFFKALELLGPVKTAVLSMTEPVFTILFSMLFLGERLSGIQALGGLCVFAGVFLVVLLQNKQ
jgi:Predicted permease, DMT superfamily